ncbi:MAG TPA: N-acetyltransferase [candidate division Zixibacteria bacterium]|nr:N-acetyltransferase [candidate division Zixibacteria bacterium]
MDPFIKGKKINLRRLHRADAISIQKYANDPEVTRFLFTPYPYTLEHAYEFIRMSHRMHRRKSGFSFGIEHKDRREIIGLIGLYHVDTTHKNAEVGFWLGRDYWGQGCTKEAMNLILKYAFNEIGLKRVFARVMHPNTVSLKLLESIGFKREGAMRKAIYKDGRWLDFIWFAMLREEFEKSK